MKVVEGLFNSWQFAWSLKVSWQWRRFTHKSYNKLFELERASALENLYIHENLSTNLTTATAELIELYCLQGCVLDRFIYQIKHTTEAWEIRRTRPKWKQAFLDTSPVHWCHYFYSRLTHKSMSHPLSIPSINMDGCDTIFGLLCKDLGKIYVSLKQLEHMLHGTITEEDLEQYLRVKYIELYLLINSRAEELHENTIIERRLDFNTLATLNRESMKQFFVIKRNELGEIKCKQSKWLQKVITTTILFGVFIKVRSIGTQNLWNMARTEGLETYHSLVRFFHDHLEEPLWRIYRTIRFDERSIGIKASASNLEAERNALASMVIDYLSSTHPNQVDTAEKIAQIKELTKYGNVSMIIDDYASSVSSPIKEAMFGPLVQLVLIQVHKLKVDAEKSVVAMDQLMRANELNFQILALIPTVLFVGSSFVWLFRWWRPKLDPKIPLEIRSYFRDVAMVINTYNTDDDFSLSNEASSINHVTYIDIGKLVFGISTIHNLAEDLPSPTKQHILDDTAQLLDTHQNIPQKLEIVNRVYHHLSSFDQILK